MSEISREDVQKIAKLARLRLAPEEISLYQSQLLKILHSMDELRGLDTSAVAPTASVLGLSNVMRSDEPEPCADCEKLLGNAPERAGPYFKVKKVIQ